MAWWRWTWDIFFSVASLIIALILGIALGNMIRGIPLDEHMEYTGDFLFLLNPYAILVGIMTTALFLMHGSIYLMLKTEGEFHEKMRRWVNPTIIFFIMCFAFTTMATLIFLPHMTESIKERPIFFLIAVINMFAVANIPREISRGRDGWAFISSCVNIICLLALFAVGSLSECHQGHQ